MNSAPQWQSQQAAAAPHQNMSNNMSTGSGSNCVAVCEQQQQQPMQQEQHHKQPPYQPPQQQQQPPVLNLAKISRNNESQTTPRRAADASLFNHHHQQQQHGYGEQLFASSPRIMNADGPTVRALVPQHMSYFGYEAAPRTHQAPTGPTAAADAGSAATGAALVPPAAVQRQQYQQQARYIVPQPQNAPASRPRPRGQPNAHPIGSSTAWLPGQPSQQKTSAATRTMHRLPHFASGGCNVAGPAAASARGQAPGVQQAAPASARAPATTRQPSNPYLQALPAATARPHHGQVAQLQGSSSHCLPPLQLATISVRGTVGDSGALRPAHATQLAVGTGVPLPGANSSGGSSQVAHVPQASSRGPGSKGDVYARMSQGLPSIETTRSARLQGPWLQGQLPPAVQHQHQHQPGVARASQQSPYCQQAAQANNLVGSTGLTPHTASLVAGSPRSPHFTAGPAGYQQQHMPQQRRAPAAQHHTVHAPQQLQQQGALGSGSIDAGHLYATHSGMTHLDPALQPGLHDPPQLHDAKAPGLFSSQQSQQLQAQQWIPQPPQQQSQEQHQSLLYSSGSISSQFAKLHSSGSCEILAAGLGTGSTGLKSCCNWQSGPAPVEASFEAIKAVRQHQGQHGTLASVVQPLLSSVCSSFAQQQQMDAASAAAQPVLPGLPFIEQQQQQQQLTPQQQQQSFYSQHLQQPNPQVHNHVFIATAAKEEAVVYDLLLHPQLEHPQLVAATSRSAMHRTSIGGAGELGAAAVLAGDSAPFLSDALKASEAAVKVKEQAGNTNRVASSAADPWSPQQQQTAPHTAASALRQWGHLLTTLEQSEIMSFQHIWFVGKSNAPKIKGEVTNAQAAAFCISVAFLQETEGQGSSDPNHGYDDSRGDYITVTGDHIAYRYEIVGCLGRGSFGQVLHCIDHASGRPMALKIIRNKKRFQKQAAIEAGILALLREQDPDDAVNIVRCYDSFTFRGHLCITFEMLSSNLYEYIKACNFQGCSLSMVRRVAHQVLATLRFLLRLNIVHCDLKPENILLREHGKMAVKVIDFGSSCYVDQRMYTYIQSRFYRSPEVILGLPYGPPIDMWSLGCILAELLTGQPIFPGEDEKEQLAYIMELLGPPPPSLLEVAPRANLFFHTGTNVPLACPANSRGKMHRPSSRTFERALGGCDDAPFIDFLQRCLHWEPQRRLTPDEALQHQWIAGSSTGIEFSVPGLSSSFPNAGQQDIRRPGTAETARVSSSGSMGNGLAALASGLLSSTARVAAGFM